MLLSTGVSVPALGILGLTPCPECLPGVITEAGAECLPSALQVSSSTADCPALFWIPVPLSSCPLSLASWRPFTLQSFVLPAAEPRPLGVGLLACFLSHWQFGGCFREIVSRDVGLAEDQCFPGCHPSLHFPGCPWVIYLF